MKKLLFLTLLLLATFTVEARSPKVLDKSNSKEPAWVKQLDQDYITIILEVESIDQGHSKSMELIKNDIISGVAVNISASSYLYDNEIVSDQKIKLTSTYESKISTIAANLPYVTGLSISMADVYWVKYRDKDKNREYYFYAIRYPFSQLDRGKLVTDFEIRDIEMYNNFKGLKSSVDNINTVEDIDKIITELKYYKEYFFDVSRLAEVTAFETQCRGLYRDITIQPDECGDGYFTYFLRFGDKYITTSRKAKISSETLSEMNVSEIGSSKKYRLSYNSRYYLQGGENKIALYYSLPSYSLSHTFYLTDK